jgi:tol-pal system protein YbgF
VDGIKDFEAAQSLAMSGKHREAFEAFDKFLQTYPNSSRLSEAQYALGYSQFSLKNYKASIATQQKLLQQFPDSPKAPDAMFNIANSQIQLADIEGAKKTLRSLLGQFPNSEVAPSAKKRLAVLDAIKSR